MCVCVCVCVCVLYDALALCKYQGKIIFEIERESMRLKDCNVFQIYLIPAKKGYIFS